MVRLLNAKLLMIVVGLLLLGVGLVVWLGRRQVPPTLLPELPPVEITPAVPQPGVVRYSWQASLLGVEKFPAYEYAPLGDGVVAQFIARWPGVLGFSGEPEAIEDTLEGMLYLWSKEGQTLVVADDGSNLSYRVDLSTGTHPTGVFGSFLPSFEQAAEIVERTLTELGATSDFLEYDSSKNKALKVGVEYVNETTFDQAELVEVHFTAKIDGYPICLESGPEQDPVLAWVGRDGKLLRLEYHPVGTVGEKIADYPLKDAEEVLRDLDSGKGVVVSSNLEGGEVVTSVTITRVYLGYLLPSPEVSLIQPVFVLLGSARTASGKTGTVTIYLGAVEGSS